MSTIYLAYYPDDGAALARLVGSRLAQVGGHSLLWAVPPVSVAATRQAVVALAQIVLVVLGPRGIDLLDRWGRRRIADPADLLRQDILTAHLLHRPIIPVALRAEVMPRPRDLPPALGYFANLAPFIIPESDDASRSAIALNVKISRLLQQAVAR
jgi:hypothetical protein